MVILRWPRRGSRARIAALSSLTLLAGCGAVSVPAPPSDPTHPLCASIMVSLPSQLVGAQRTETSSQSTAAWSRGSDIVVFRCGVTPPPPTTEFCTTIESRHGTGIDWIVIEQEESNTVLFTTYGREPAIDISVPRTLTSQPSAATIELAGLIALIPQQARCLSSAELLESGQ